MLGDITRRWAERKFSARFAAGWRWVMLLPVAGMLVLLAGCGGLGGAGGSGSSQPPSKQQLQSSVKHIVFMMQENRSFDTYFGHLNEFRSANGMPTDVDGIDARPGWAGIPTAEACNPADAFAPDADQGPVCAFKLQTMCIENTSADWSASHINFNRFEPASNTFLGDGFVSAAAGSARFQGSSDISGKRAMGYYTAQDLYYHYWLASMFGTSDRWFAAAPTQTEPNRLYFLAATSHGYAHQPNPVDSNVVKNIFQLLENAGVSWKIYVSDPPLNGKLNTTLNYFQPFAGVHQDKVVPVAQYFADLQAGTLPSVAMIEPGYLSGTDQHPGVGNNIQTGMMYTKTLIDALMQSSAWKESIFIMTFDEGGGLYDHVAPPTNVPHPDGIPPQDLFPDELEKIPGDFTRYAFRVPLMVASPFSKPHYVSHTTTDFTAILKLIETRWNLPNLTRRDAAAPDMTEFFDFNNPAYLTPPPFTDRMVKGPCYDGLP